jgi:hypothetical protein
MPQLLVVGAPRSGTLFTSRLLRAAGLDIGHEMAAEAPHIREGGAVGWVYAVDREYVMVNGHSKGSVAGLVFDHTWHQVRHPLRTIASMGALGERVFQWAGYADNSLANRLRFWCDWNERCSTLASWRFRIEDLQADSETWRRMCTELSLRIGAFPDVPSDTNTLQHASLSWDDLSRADEAQAQRARQLAADYGY